MARGAGADLIVRYNFKIATYAELRQDPKTALKYARTGRGAPPCRGRLCFAHRRPGRRVCPRYYDAAYMALLDLVPTARTPLRLTELKVVGQYINFKVCAPMHLDCWGGREA